MKKKVIIGIIIVAVIAVFIAAFFLYHTSNIRKNHSVTLDDKLCEKIAEYRDRTPKTIYCKGNITVSDKEIDFAKLELQYSKLIEIDENTISDEEAIDYVCQRKMLINDAKSRGLFVSSAEVNHLLSNYRNNKGVSLDGEKVSDEKLSELLKANGINYIEYEEFLAERIEYALLYYDYANVLYRELKQINPDIDFNDLMVYNYINSLIDNG